MVYFCVYIFYLTILQCILYFVLGYMLKDNYDWLHMSIIFAILLGIQFITHIKGVSQGMMIHQLMIEEDDAMMKFIKKMKKDNKDYDNRN